MKICNTGESIRDQVKAWKANGKSVAFVPTMGNLHPGHISLVKQASSQADKVVVSIFVNPMQFNEASDFDAYPRTFEQDRLQLKENGVDAVFLPSVDEIYPEGQENTTKVTVPVLSDVLEGEHRPGHFEGVATVVNKLLNLVPADVALFGEKDFQQLMLIRRMVTDLNLDIRIISVPTMRETDGLAMSSRNGRLNLEQRQQAPVLYKVLKDVADRIQKGETGYSALESSAMAELAEQGFQAEYVAIRSRYDLSEPNEGEEKLVVLAAARLGATRLIDNIPIDANLNH